MKKLPVQCPSCSGELAVKTLFCNHCETQVSGAYPLPLLARLDEEEQAFVLAFVRASGSLKEMSALLKLSYPSVRNMLDELIHKINQLDHESC